jgi:hypothetical protein
MTAKSAVHNPSKGINCFAAFENPSCCPPIGSKHIQTQDNLIKYNPFQDLLFLLSDMSRAALGPTQSHFNRYHAALFPDIKRPQREAEHNLHVMSKLIIC